MTLATLAPPPPTTRSDTVFGPQLPTAADYQAAARRGASLLDQHHSNWARSIEPRVLNIGDPHCCVLGQLFFTYGLGLTTLFGRNVIMESPLGSDLPSWYGFDSVLEHDLDLITKHRLPGWSALTEQWAAEVAVRRMGV